MLFEQRQKALIAQLRKTCPQDIFAELEGLVTTASEPLRSKALLLEHSLIRYKLDGGEKFPSVKQTLKELQLQQKLVPYPDLHKAAWFQLGRMAIVLHRHILTQTLIVLQRVDDLLQYWNSCTQSNLACFFYFVQSTIYCLVWEILRRRLTVSIIQFIPEETRQAYAQSYFFRIFSNSQAGFIIWL